LGILKQNLQNPAVGSRGQECAASRPNPPPGLATFLDYLPGGTIFVLCEPEVLAGQAAGYGERIPEGDPFFVTWKDLLDRLDAAPMTQLRVSEVAAPLAEIEDVGPDADGNGASKGAASRSDPLMLCFQSLDAYRPLDARVPELHVAEAQRHEFFAQLHRWMRQGYWVNVFCNNEGERERFVEIQEEYGFANDARSVAHEGMGTKTDGAVAAPTPRLLMHLGALARGFLFDEARLVVVTDAEIFGRYKIQRPRRLKSPHASVTRSALDINFAELEEGDLVVHLQHGIGRYLGLKFLPVGSGRTSGIGSGTPAEIGQECLTIEYAASGGDQSPPKLYVPVSEAHLVSKYVGAGNARPPLSTLGGNRWAKTKAQAERAVRDLAGELLALQAARESLPGHAFGFDVPWQREFESAFIYEETADQMRAITDTKRDMEVARPMDRLICGDVGFGKTEVAIRAAFKAVMGGKQVAILVPTTVLAQ
jgi:transcription-repair coupling factor (superfamily II helicase)